MVGNKMKYLNYYKINEQAHVINVSDVLQALRELGFSIITLYSSDCDTSFGLTTLFIDIRTNITGRNLEREFLKICEEFGFDEFDYEEDGRDLSVIFYTYYIVNDDVNIELKNNNMVEPEPPHTEPTHTDSRKWWDIK